MMRVRGGGDAAGAVQGGGTEGSLGTTGGGNDDDESEGRRTPGLPKRYEPMECTNVEDLKDLTLAALIGRALWHYKRGHHPTPNMFTKKGNLRAMDTENGVVARGYKFVERETDPSRVRAKSESTAHAQDVMTHAIQVYGQQAVVRELIDVLIHAGADDDDEEVYYHPWP